MSETPNYVEYKKGNSPLLIAVPHDAINPGEENFFMERVPQFFQDNLVNRAQFILDAKTANDSGAKHVAGFDDSDFGDHDRLSTTCPRTVLDLNRDDTNDVSRTDVDGYAVEGEQIIRPRRHGLFWSASVAREYDGHNGSIADAFKKPLPPEQAEKLKQMAYFPWQKLYRSHIEDAIDRHGFSVAFEVHTFPANLVGQVRTPAEFAGSYLIRGISQRGKVRDMPDAMEDIIRHGLMPDVFIVSNWDHKKKLPQACHSIIHQIATEALDRQELIWSNGCGPFQGDIGVTAMNANPQNGSHILGLEFIAHEFNPGKADGCVDFIPEKLERHRAAVKEMRERIISLTADQLRT